MLASLDLLNFMKQDYDSFFCCFHLPLQRTLIALDFVVVSWFFLHVILKSSEKFVFDPLSMDCNKFVL